MGLLDSFARQLDNGLKAVESGTLEKRLTQLADSLDKTSGHVAEVVERTTTRSSDMKIETARADGTPGVIQPVRRRITGL